MLNALAYLPGSYALTVVNTDNNCTSLAVVLVQMDTVPPTAVAKATGTISCVVNQATLNGTGSSTASSPIFGRVPGFRQVHRQT